MGVAFTRDGRAFLNAFAFRVPVFLDFAFAFPRSYIQFFPISKVDVPAFQILLHFLFCVPPRKIFSHAYILRAFQRIKCVMVCVMKGVCDGVSDEECVMEGV